MGEILQMVRAGELTVSKIYGKKNLASVLTKHIGSKELQDQLINLGMISLDQQIILEQKNILDIIQVLVKQIPTMYIIIIHLMRQYKLNQKNKKQLQLFIIQIKLLISSMVKNLHYNHTTRQIQKIQQDKQETLNYTFLG